MQEKFFESCTTLDYVSFDFLSFYKLQFKSNVELFWPSTKLIESFLKLEAV